MSFVGGGTDLPSFYKHHGGEVISTTIDKYITVTVDSNLFNLSHNPHITAVLAETGVDMSVPISIESDMPVGSGLGGSSALTVGLLNALWEYDTPHGNPDDYRRNQNAHWLARTACEVEIDKMGNTIGKQDQYAVAFGGFNRIYFNRDHAVRVEPISVPLDDLEDSLMLFDTGIQRDANRILKEQSERANHDTLLRMREQVDHFHRHLIDGDIEKIGRLLDRAWRYKQTLAKGIMIPHLHNIYTWAKGAGAWGGKILGAGGGGHFLFVVPQDKQGKVIEMLDGYAKHIPFRFENKGSHIVE